MRLYDVAAVDDMSAKLHSNKPPVTKQERQSCCHEERVIERNMLNRDLSTIFDRTMPQ